MTAAPVNKMIPLSTVDGPGARSAVFLQGCNIACAYCHNPETQRLCNHCGLCVSACPADALAITSGRVVWNEAACTGCGACLNTCPNRASPKIRRMTPRQVLDAMLPNRPFIRGLTVSGGECMLYPHFLTELFRLAKAQSLGCLMDSNGTLPFEGFPELMAACDGVMLDVKAWDPAVYTALTGASSNAAVKRNLVWLAKRGKLEEVRLVVLPGEVDADAVLRGAARALGEYAAQTRLKLIVFRPFGVKGRLENAAPPPAREMARLQTLAGQLGFGQVVTAGG